MTIHRNVAYNISQCEVRPEDQDEVFDAMKSFPSGHAQIACFTATFLIVSLSLSLSLFHHNTDDSSQIYLQLRLQTSHSLLLRFWLQLLLVIMAATSSISRVTDNRHHTADVWVGAAIGIVVAIIGSAEIPDVHRNEDATSHPTEQSISQKRDKKEKRPSKIRLLSSSFGLR